MTGLRLPDDSDHDQSPPTSRVASLLRRSITLLALGLLVWLSLVSRPISIQPEEASGAQAISPSPSIAQPTHTRTPRPSPTASPTASPAPPQPLLPTTSLQTPLSQGLVFLSLEEAGYAHLFAYQPLRLPFTRLTYGEWDDINPALSPDGNRLAFSSNRSGQWDLYLLDLSSGVFTRLTDTPEYDGSPSWSPDGLYLAFESYLGDLEVLIWEVSGGQPPVALSNHPSADFSPDWSPDGRRIAFISNRSGESEVWLADLDKVEGERFTNLSQDAQAEQSHPAWSPNGSQLAWVSRAGGTRQITLWAPSGGARLAGSGSWPTFSPDGTSLLTSLEQPNQSLLTAYRAENSLLDLPPLILPGVLAGLDWGESSLPEILHDPLAAAAAADPKHPWLPALTAREDVPNGRQHLAELPDIQAPYPVMHDLVDEAFLALRGITSQASGWDFLGTLENAFVPLTAPLLPGLGQDWLYTGRAFSFSPLPVNAGWAVVVPEEFGSQTYWRIYLRARDQDGSQGRPMFERPWDFSARVSGNPAIYEQGGQLSDLIPAGYWIDFTSLAAACGWDRLPALTGWRAFSPAARFNEFIQDGGLSWQQAMLELVPPEALITPTSFLPPTMTPTRTPSWPRSTPLPP